MAELGAEEFRREAFWRDVEDGDTSENAILEGGDDLFAGETRIDGCCPDAVMPQVLHLVFHQRNQRGDNDTGALAAKRRHLKGDGLSAASRHQSQGIMSTAYRLDDFPLDTAKVIIAPILLENLPIIIHYSLFLRPCGSKRAELERTIHSSEGLISSICSCTSLRL